jgi:hypothetical protein
LLSALALTKVQDEYGATISLPSILGWWGTVLDALPNLAGNLRFARVRLGFGLYPYGPNSLSVVGVDFGAAPTASRRAEYHQIPPWHTITDLFDPFAPPRQLLEAPIRDLLDLFSYGRTDATVRWFTERWVEGTLADMYPGPEVGSLPA